MRRMLAVMLVLLCCTTRVASAVVYTGSDDGATLTWTNEELLGFEKPGQLSNVSKSSDTLDMHPKRFSQLGTKNFEYSPAKSLPSEKKSAVPMTVFTRPGGVQVGIPTILYVALFLAIITRILWKSR